METNFNNINNIQTKPFDLEKTSSKTNLSEVYNGVNYSYLNEFNLFVAHFNAIPNYIQELNIDCVKANKWFVKANKSEIKELYYCKMGYLKYNTCDFDLIFYFLYDDLIVNFDTIGGRVKFLFKKTAIIKVVAIISGINKFLRKRKPEISLLVSSSTGIGTTSLLISKPKLNIEDNYNDDFKEINQTIIKMLSKKNNKGLVLLHGKPGTGKTSYIRYLISSGI